MIQTVATVLTALGAAVVVLGLIGLLRPRMYESMMARSAAKGPIPRLRVIATVEVIVGVVVAVVGVLLRLVA